MNFPLPFNALLVAGEAPEGRIFEVYLNCSGINTIEVPHESVVSSIGQRLCIKFLNRGAPIHITATASNAGMFTDFFHENLYVIDEIVLNIPIRQEAQTGFFDIEIIAGYGAMKAAMRVDVTRAPAASASRPKEIPMQPVAHGRPHPLMVVMGIALILYAAWLYTNIIPLNLASFIILIVGALYTWYRLG